MIRNTEEKFWATTEFRLSGCLEWCGNFYSNGYGKFSYLGKNRLVHRLSYMFTFHDPGKLCVCHSCDNRKCVNPNHLFLGTHKDNMRDMINKNRQPDRRGELGGKVIFKESDVFSIVELYNSGMNCNKLAKKFNVHKNTIYEIISRNNWSHLDLPVIKLRRMGRGLDKSTLLQIREDIKVGLNYTCISKKFNIDPSTVSRIANGKTYTEEVWS